MKRLNQRSQLTHIWQRTRVILASVLLLLTSVIGNFNVFHASALGQLTARKITLTSSTLSTSTTYTYDFTLATAGQIQSIKFEACTTPLNTCSAPTGLNINAGTEASRANWSGATTFTRDAVGGGGCTPANNVLCIKRTDATSESGTQTLGWNTQTNPSSANTSFYMRITTYSDTGWTTGVDNGVVAASTAAQLTINARVAENLTFCTGTINGAAPTSCAGITGTTVDLGVIDYSTVAVTPVASGSGGNNVNGAAWLTTNAGTGATITYYSEQNTSSGALKVAGAACSGSSTTDQCFNSAPSTQTSGATGAIVAGTEKFGMTVSSIDVSQSTTSALTRSADYDGDGATGSTCNTGTGAFCWVWNATTTAASLASSTGPVDKEMLVLKYAATAATTTPFGSYTVTTTFVATPTF